MKEKGIKEFERVKYRNLLWIGVDKGTGCCLYEDFKDNVMKSNEFVHFIDYDTHDLNVKRSYKRNKYNLIIITSTIPLN